MIRVKSLLALAVVAAASGCATPPVRYELPPPSSTNASLTFLIGFRGNARQDFSVIQSDDCSDAHLAGRLAVTTGRSTSTSIATGRRLVLTAHTLYVDIVPYGRDDRFATCLSGVSFVPLAGHRYTIVHRAVVGLPCELRVTDDTTSFAPPDLRSTEPVINEPLQGAGRLPAGHCAFLQGP